MLFGEPIYRQRNNSIQAILPYRPEDSCSCTRRGDSTPPDYIKIAMAKFFDVSLDYLMGVTDIPTPISKKKDILNQLEEINFALENVPNLALRGDNLDDETRELLKTSLAMAIQISKTKAGKNE